MDCWIAVTKSPAEEFITDYSYSFGPRGKWRSRIAIPIALHRPQIGPPARNGKKMAENWILAPLKKRGKNGRKIGKLVQKSIFKPIFGPFFCPFFGHFSPFSRWGQNPFFGHFFPFRAGGPIWGLYRAIGIANQGYSYCYREKSRKTMWRLEMRCTRV